MTRVTHCPVVIVFESFSGIASVNLLSRTLFGNRFIGLRSTGSGVSDSPLGSRNKVFVTTQGFSSERRFWPISRRQKVRVELSTDEAPCRIVRPDPAFGFV